jgi:hypothetical protein
MSSADARAQTKIQNIEEQLLTCFRNVHRRQMVTQKHTESMAENGRVKKKDGFYMFTIQKTSDSHGILVYKETQPNGEVIFYIYDPNGKRYINDGYEFNIADNRLNNRMSPDRSINDHVGHCALWCIVVIILWNSFSPNDRFIALDLFHAKMLEAPQTRIDFITSIYHLLDKRDFSAQSETKAFVRQVRDIIERLSIGLPIVLPLQC